MKRDTERSFSRRRVGVQALAVLALGGAALAAPLRATVTFPQGLEVNKRTPVVVRLEPGENSDGARRTLESLRGEQAALVFEGGQYDLSVRQYPLGKIGGTLGTVLQPESPERFRVSLRFSDDGRHWASVGEVQVPARPGTTFDLEFEEPLTRRSVPIGQVGLWVLGTVVAGLLALRGVSAFQ